MPKETKDTKAAAARMGEALRQLQEIKKQESDAERREAMKGPVAKPTDLLVTDPASGERRVYETATLHGLWKIRYRRMTLGDLHRMPEEERSKDPIDWSLETKAAVIESCLVEPELREDGPVTAEWLEENVGPHVVDDLVVTIKVESDYKSELPKMLAEGDDEGKGSRGADESETPSLSSDSTISATA